jgi:hypothetical protein
VTREDEDAEEAKDAEAKPLQDVGEAAVDEEAAARLV